MSDQQYKTQEEATKDAKAEVQYWLDEQKLADKREEDWRKLGEEVTAIYEAEKKKEHQYNILFSNTETLAPVLYTLPPRPLVKRRYLDRDPIGNAGAKTIQRMLEYQSDTNEEEYDNFDELMKGSLLSALVPGRGVVWWKFDAEISEQAEATEGLEPEVKGEKVVGEVVEWTKFRHGFARSWNKVPWASREHIMTFEELKASFGAVANEVKLTSSDGGEDKGKANLSANEGSLKTAVVYEIWNKLKKEVIFISPGLPEKALKRTDDPHGLEGFFPCTRPLQFLRRIKRLEPMCPYATYKEQAEELNRVTVRINKIIGALKVRGFYDSQIEGLDLVLEQEDNKLIPADNVAALQQGRKLDDAIWLMPIEKLITVLQQLYVQREQVKQVIYEIMGIADIMRGSSQASETATAQNLKSQWGGLRVKRWQNVMACYVRDNLRIVASISSKHLPIKLIAQMTGLNFVWPEEKQQAQMLLQQGQAMMAQMQAMQAGGMQPDPQMMAQVQQLQPQMQQAQQTAAAIDWGQVKAIISDQTLRNFRVDIETNSTLDPDATEDKQSINELMMAISQFFQSVGPLIQAGVLPFEMAKQMLLTMVRRFKLGSEVEDYLESMTQPPPPQGGGEEAQKLLEERQQFEQEKQKAAEGLRKEQQKLEDLKREIEFARREAELQAKYDFKEHELAQKSAREEHLRAIQSMVSEHQATVKEHVSQATAALKAEGQRQQHAIKGHQQAMQQQTAAKTDNSATLQQLAAALDNVAKMMASPRQIVRGPDGKATHSELMLAAGE